VTIGRSRAVFVSVGFEGTIAILDLPSSIIPFYLFFACTNAFSTIS
jgi:hypothetical protein